jgi:phenylacetate-CoA ligase
MLQRTFINGARGATATLLAYPLAERLEGRDVRAKVRALDRQMADPFAERRPRSFAAVVDTVRDAAAHVPYYRDLFARIGFDPERLLIDESHLRDIPYLTKDIVRAEGERLLRDDHAAARKHVSKTGGSTGPAARIVYDQDAADWSSAATRHLRHRIGKRHFHSELHFASKFPDQFPLRDRLREHAKCLAMNRHNIFFASFEPGELEAIWRNIKRIRPYLVHGHPSTMYHLALHVGSRGGAAGVFRIFESSGELLSSRQRDTIARVFRCNVVDRYGLAEAGIVAYQAGLHDPSMLVLDPIAWPEVAGCDGVDAPGIDAEGRVGELVITTTKNRMMPLIRYRTGDIAAVAETARGFVLEELVGRIHDVVEIAGERRPTHYVQDVLDRIGGIREFQIELRDRRPVLRLVPEDGADTDGIRDRIARYWGTAVGVEFIAPSDLRLLGARQKFRHLVLARTDPADVCPAVYPSAAK